ncbi:MAG: SDR family oxidoreductase [Gammaproteobacteria bacterium]|nr:SDR family oxidoreductase [Gammaproteobacteria bacterium]
MTSPDFSLNEKVALVTGAGRGLGLEIAKALAGAGAHVLVNGRNLEGLKAAVESIESLGRSASPLPFDITDEAAVDKIFEGIRDAYGRLDILVNNVGIRDRRGLFEFEMDAVRRLMEVDLIAPFNLCRQAARQMMEGGEGRIINITSIAGPIANAGDAAYTAAKGGLEALTRAVAAEVGASGVTVNAIAPGFFATQTNADLVADKDIAAWLKKRSALGRWGDPKEIAGAVVFFASPAASYVTGQILAVDGGYLAHF